MPANGEINKELAVYKSVCCGAEIAILPGAIFPDCPNHPNLTTKWKPVIDDQSIPHASELFPKKTKSGGPAAA